MLDRPSLGSPAPDPAGPDSHELERVVSAAVRGRGATASAPLDDGARAVVEDLLEAEVGHLAGSLERQQSTWHEGDARVASQKREGRARHDIGGAERGDNPW